MLPIELGRLSLTLVYVFETFCWTTRTFSLDLINRELIARPDLQA